MLDSIRIESELISLEAFAPSQGLKAITARLPSLVTKVSDFVSEKFSSKPTEFRLVDSRASTQALKVVNYGDIRTLQAFKSPGQSVPYLELIGVLESIQSELVDRLMPEALVPFDTWLAIQLTNPEQLSSVRNGAHIQGFVQHNVESFAKKLSACFDPKDPSTSTELGDLMRRNADWEVIVKRSNALAEKAMSLPRKEIVTITERITTNLNTLIERIRAEDSGYTLSGSTVAALASLCYNLAREIEFYSVFMYQVQLHSQALEDTAKQLASK